MTDIHNDSECLVWQGDNAFRPIVCDIPYFGDRDYLKLGMTEWIGPIPPDSHGRRWHEEQLDCAVGFARRAKFDGAPLLVTSVGRYVRLHRLATGPAKKLSDWKELPVDRRMLIHPEATVGDLDKARARVAYLRSKEQGRFAVEMDANDTLWIERLA